MKIKIIAILAIFTLCSCIPYLGKTPTTSQNYYFEPNYPKIEIEFPFNIYYSDFRRATKNGVLIFQHHLKSEDPEINIYINKAVNNENGTRLILNDFDHIEKTMYFDSFESANCKVLKFKNNGQTYIESRITKLISKNYGFDIKIRKKTHSYATEKEWKENHNLLIEEFIGYSNYMLAQLR